MIVRSMTGYGKASTQFEDKSITIEVKSVNSKQLDISIRCPVIYREREYDIRYELSKNVERGKVEVNVNIDQQILSKPVQINQNVIRDYLNQIQEIATEQNIPVNEYTLATVLRLPETLRTENTLVSAKEWEVFFSCLAEALTNFTNFRLQEGKALETDILKRVETLLENLDLLEKFESNRIQRVRDRIAKNLADIIPAVNIDQNRFEQELIFFIEKFDITEEKVRLRNHCQYFRQTFKEESSGRKLSFISQEMGREINTIGSKANDSDIQRHVVIMKDELEKIKEQLMNIL